MAEIGTAGITPTDLTGYVELLETALQTAFGAGLSDDPETPQGQLAGVLSLTFAQVDELAVYVANGLNPALAQGRQLDDMGALFSIDRIAGERSSVTATLSGRGGTQIPGNSRVRTAQNSVFASDADALIPSSGSLDVLFRSVEAGPIRSDAGTLNQIVDVISGWTSVTNAADAVLGRDVETDSEYRLRYLGEVSVHEVGSLDAVRSRVLDVENVTHAIVRDNATAATVTIQGVDVAARSLIVVVLGGAAQDIAEAIDRTKGIGVQTVGTESEDVTIAGTVTTTIRFERVTAVPVTVAVSLAAGAGFPSDGLATIRANLLKFIDGLDIAEAIDERRILTPIQSVPGHTVSAVTVQIKQGGAALRSPDLNERFTLASADLTLTITP